MEIRANREEAKRIIAMAAGTIDDPIARAFDQILREGRPAVMAACEWEIDGVGVPTMVACVLVGP